MSTAIAPSEPAAVTDVVPADRIEVLDVLRGIALLGMYVVHFYDYAIWALPENAPTTWWRQGEQWFLDGRFYTMFAMLFGIGFAVQLSRADARGEDIVPRYLRRLAALAVFGLIAEIVFGYNVLFGYATWGLFLLPIRRWSTKALFVLFLLCSASLPIYNVTRMAVANARGTVAERVTDIQQANQSFQARAKEKNDAGESPNWGTVIAARARFMPWFHWQWSWHPGGSFVLMLAGLLAFRLGIFQDPAATRRTIMWLMLAGAVSFVIATFVLPIRAGPQVNTGGLAQLATSTTPVQDMIGAITRTNFWRLPRDSWLAFTYMGVVLLLVAHDAAWLRRLAPFAWNGRMALTNYMTQVAFLDLTFTRHGLGLAPSPAMILPGAFALFIVQALFSRWWLARYRLGPLEWIWRCATYWRIEPNRRVSSNSAVVSVPVATG
jgi:uncharacterized protein